ncbi:MAG: hypothetical protein WC565_07885 [Parcubacteria group bacterium]|jgi:hypothetical protein
MSELSQRARALGEKMLRLLGAGKVGPGAQELGEILLLCASELDRTEPKVEDVVLTVAPAEMCERCPGYNDDGYCCDFGFGDSSLPWVDGRSVPSPDCALLLGKRVVVEMKQ